MKIPRAHCGWYLAGLGLLAAGPAGCDPVPAETPAQVIALVPPAQVDSNALTLVVGEAVEIRWQPGEPEFPAWLVYRNRATLTEEVIVTDALGGSHTWTIPRTLEPDADYEVRQYDPQDGALLALSSPLRFTISSEDAGSTGLPAGSACTGNAACDDLLFCNGAETCLQGFCTNGIAPCASGLCAEAEQGCIPAPCATDANCTDGEACADHICIPLNPGSNGLTGLAFHDGDTNALVDFAVALEVGARLNLAAPTLSSTTARILDGCSCRWSVLPSSAGDYDSADACTTAFTIAAAGLFELLVDVDCAGAAMRYVQGATAVAPPPATPSIEVLAEETLPPYVVRFNLRLKDAQGAVIPAGVTADHFRVMENDLPVDFTETNRFVVPAENLPLRVVLVLDYTSSMAKSGALPDMIASAARLVQAEHFTATHQFAVVEFHDRTGAGEGFRLAVPLTTADAAGKDAIVAGLPRADELEAGLTRVWDALELALGTLAEQERQPGEAQAVVFLTDGRDTTSAADPLSLADVAAQAGVMLYPIGFGDVADTETLLRELAERTAGAYFSAADAEGLRAVFAQIAADLRGQWNLSYVTPRNSGSVKVDLEFTWQGQSDTYSTTFEAGGLAGNIHQGRITVLDREYNPFTERTSFVLHALYIPRNIDRFRFLFAHSDAEFTLQAEGGLTTTAAGWSLTNTGAGAFLLLNPDALEYGAFGNFGTVSVPGDVETLQVTHDDALYAHAAQAKSFVFAGDLWSAPYTLEAVASPDDLGRIVISPEKPGYGHGETVTVTAVPTGGVFTEWSGNASATASTIEVIMDDDKIVVAEFE